MHTPRTHAVEASNAAPQALPSVLRWHRASELHRVRQLLLFKAVDIS